VPRRIIVLGLLAALSAFSTGCCGRIRQCIANRWHANHPYGFCGGYYGGGGCCTPAYKMAAPAGCSSCGPEGGPPVIYQQGPVQGPTVVPNIGSPMPLIGSSSNIPGIMPPKN
jgi:hypothetical protein